MNRLRKDTLNSIAAAALAIVLLLLASAGVLKAIETEFRGNVASHVLSRRDTMLELLDLMHADSMARVRTIAEEPRLKKLARSLARAPGHAALNADLATWITPLYQSRGFEGYSLIAPDTLAIVASGSPAYIGQPISTEAALEAIKRSERVISAVARPAAATRPVMTFGTLSAPGIPYQLVCARIDEGQTNLGYLCLRDNPGARLYRILEAGRPGRTGESYIIDAEARILSPIRFEGDLAAPPGAGPGWSLFRIFARTPEATNVDGKTHATESTSAPLTRMAATLLETRGTTPLIEDYADYRGRRVIGAGRWLPEMQMGLVIEQDMDDAYRSFHFARAALAALVGIGVLLIIALTVAQWRSRRSLARSEQQLAAFRDHIPATMHMKDVTGRYLMVNPKFESIFRFWPGYAVGKTDAELMSAEEARVRQAEHDQVVRTGEPFTKNETIRDSKGAEVVYSVVRFPIRGEDPLTVEGVGTVGIDMTDQIKASRQLEELSRTLEKRVAERTEQLAAARDQAQAASEAKAEFLANVSHEIRTPLNAVIGMSHLASRVNTEPRVEHYLHRILSSSHHLLGIVSDILDLSRIEAGKLPVDAVEFSVERMLEHVAGLVSERANAKGLELVIAIEPGVPESLLGDPMRLGQILINFANNAVKFTESGEVVLRVRALERHNGTARMRFEVTDTGIGIANEKLPLLFTPFQQLDGSMARRFEGTGLGLAISKNLAELMGGDVAVTSEVGRGSVFCVQLDLRVASSQPPRRSAPVDFRNRRALVVDDNTTARRQLALVLRSLSFDVETVESGEDAIARTIDADVEHRAYDVIFIDGGMPLLDGQQTGARIRKLSLRMRQPRLVLLGSGNVDANAASSQRTFDAIMAKPVTPSAVFHALVDVFSPNAPERTSTAPEQPQWDCLKACHVLLVEDNAINQEVVEDLLELVGARVTTVGDGTEALRVLDDHRFDAILMDVHLPVMSGLETTAEIRKNMDLIGTPIIALTANALAGDRMRCLEAGMDDYIAKPIDPNEMYATLARHCRPHAAANDPESGRPAEPKRNGDDAAFAALSAIPGLDTQQGLSYMGGRVDLYKKLARRVAYERSELPQRLDAAVRAGDLKELRELIHSAKSVLGTMGALGLQRTCADLEQALHEGKLDHAALADFRNAYSELIASIARAVQEHATAFMGDDAK